MKKLTALLVLFFLAISIPLVYLVLRTYRGLEQEELSRLRFFAETIFEEMEAELGELVAREEARPIEAYHAGFEGAGAVDPGRTPPYILGYMQNNPDGSFQTPTAGAHEQLTHRQLVQVEQLKQINDEFNRTRYKLPKDIDIKPHGRFAGGDQYGQARFAAKYLRQRCSRKSKIYLRHKTRRVENLTPEQVLRVAQGDQRVAISHIIEARRAIKGSDTLRSVISRTLEDMGAPPLFGLSGMYRLDPFQNIWPELFEDSDELPVEIDPMQSIFLDDNHLYLFRRILLNNQVYCQGVVIRIYDLMAHLMQEYFAGQPMAQFTHLHLRATSGGRDLKNLRAGTASFDPAFSLERSFPRPFSFLQASLTCDLIPSSPARNTLNRMMVLLVAVILIGLYAIYKSTRAVVELSERRTGFVSAVTHELKTPLSTIRMYIEMLEQGIARNQEREHDYYRILGSETSRLARLINNVLEFSKLEKRQRHLNLTQGTLDDVIKEVSDIMHNRVLQAGFELHVEKDETLPECTYDREAMIQVLLNLIENSLKFGKDAPQKELRLCLARDGRRVRLSLADTGPGIPRRALKKVFENFYRVDNDLTRTTGGTGIGLALVKSLITAMGGSVRAVNNDGPGCTIIITMPAA